MNNKRVSIPSPNPYSFGHEEAASRGGLLGGDQVLGGDEVGEGEGEEREGGGREGEEEKDSSEGEENPNATLADVASNLEVEISIMAVAHEVDFVTSSIVLDLHPLGRLHSWGNFARKRGAEGPSSMSAPPLRDSWSWYHFVYWTIFLLCPYLAIILLPNFGCTLQGVESLRLGSLKIVATWSSKLRRGSSLISMPSRRFPIRWLRKPS